MKLDVGSDLGNFFVQGLGIKPFTQTVIGEIHSRIEDQQLLSRENSAEVTPEVKQLIFEAKARVAQRDSIYQAYGMMKKEKHTCYSLYQSANRNMQKNAFSGPEAGVVDAALLTLVVAGVVAESPALLVIGLALSVVAIDTVSERNYSQKHRHTLVMHYVDCLHEADRKYNLRIKEGL